MFAESGKEVLEQRSQGLRSITVALKLRRKCNSNFCLTWLGFEHAKTAVADQLVSGREHDTDLIPHPRRARFRR